MELNLERYNERIQQATKDGVAKMKLAGSALGIVHRQGSPSKKASLPRVSDKYKKKDGGIRVVSIKFPRSLIYTMKGAGKGRGGSKGSKWTDKYGAAHTTNPKSFGKMGTAGRTEKPFFNNTLDGPTGMVENIATVAAEELGSVIINNLFIN